MNAQDKAKELVEKYEKLLGYDLPASNQYELIKQCAIIAVDEIIKACSFEDHTKKKYFEECNSLPDFNFSNYWIEVKQEIENL